LHSRDAPCFEIVTRLLDDGVLHMRTFCGEINDVLVAEVVRFPDFALGHELYLIISAIIQYLSIR
jgi:hypothetical protein